MQSQHRGLLTLLLATEMWKHLVISLIQCDGHTRTHTWKTKRNVIHCQHKNRILLWCVRWYGEKAILWAKRGLKSLDSLLLFFVYVIVATFLPLTLNWPALRSMSHNLQRYIFIMCFTLVKMPFLSSLFYFIKFTIKKICKMIVACASSQKETNWKGSEKERTHKGWWKW